MQQKTIFILIHITFCFWINNALCQTIILEQSSGPISIDKEHIMVFDTSALLDIQNVYENRTSYFKKTSTTPVYSPDFDSHWVLFKILSNVSGSFILDYQQVFIDKVDFYLFEKDALISTSNTGFTVPFKSKDVKSRYQAFRLNVKKDRLYYVLINSRNVNQYFSSRLFLELINSLSFQFQNDSNLVQLSLISGCLFFVGLFALSLFFYSKESIYAYYGIYVLLITSYFASSHGIFTQFFDINSFIAGNKMHTFSSIIGFVFHILYLGKFFRINQYESKKFYYAHYFIIFIFTIHVLLVCIKGLSPIPDFIIHFIFGLLVVTFIMVGLYKKQKEAYLYIMASGPVLICYLVITLGNLKVIPINKGIFYNFNLPILFEALGLGAGLLYVFVQERRKLQLELFASKNQVIKEIILAQENERANIASDLHDDLGGTLSFLQRELNDINNKHKGKYATLFELIVKAVQDLRLISHRMLPVFFEVNGFIKALQYDLQMLNSNEVIKVNLIVDGEERRFEKEKELHCYRVVKELVNNALKHSKAREVIVQVLYRKDLLYISVEDNGLGLDPETLNNGVGLKNVKIRCEFLNTELIVDSSSSGTIMSIEIPY